LKRLRSVGLLALFFASYLALLVIASSLLPPQGMVGSTLLVLATAVLVGVLLLVLVEKRPWQELGIGIGPATVRELWIGLLLPCAALLLVVCALLVTRSLTYQRDGGTFLGLLFGSAKLLLVLAVPAAAEEALFRGYPFQKLVAAIGPVFATLLASAGFAYAHRHNPGVNTFALVNIFVAGVLLSLAYLRTRSLWFATALHLGWNWQMAGPLDLPVSGLELYDAPLYEPSDGGRSWLTGGGFGPEGGLAGLLALLLLTVAVWLYTKRNYQGND
jgi:membrane protease YdiL (CAAX protease family)